MFSKRWARAHWLVCLSIVAALPGLSQEDLLAAGPMLGHVDIVEATIWVQTKTACKVAIEYQTEDGSGQKTKALTSQEDGYFITHHLLTGLKENTTYNYKVWIDGEPVNRDYPMRFTTQQHWQYRTKPPEVRFTMGSCLFVNDKPYDRPGTPYGGRYDILGKITAEAPQFMIWLGDNTYFRISDFTPTRMNYRHAHTRALPELQPLLASTANYALWDDHDYGPDNSDRSYVFKGEALELFKAYWANPSWGLPETPGVFGSFQVSDIEFFLLDDRYYRAPNRLNDPDKAYFGQAQLQWLKDSLASSRATFKVIINGNQFNNSNTRFESVTHYPAEHRDFMDWLMLSGIEGIVFFSGDRHHTELLKIDRPGSYPIYEYTSSPLTSSTPPKFTWEADNSLRVEGTLVWDKRNFGKVEVLGEGRSRRMVLSCIDVDGETRWTHTIPKQALQNPRPQ